MKLRFLAILLSITCITKVSSQSLDVRLLESINSKNAVPSDKFFQFMSNSNTYVNLAIPAGLGIAGLVRHDDEMVKNALVTVGASAFNAGFTYILKYTVNRKRPFDAYPNLFTKKSDAGDPSFPSGHTSSAFATATSLSLAYPKWYVIAPSYLWAGTVAYSRLHLGVHYPSDVLGGIIVGVCSSYITYKAGIWLNNSYKKNHGIQ
jgi:membrane-associated phospholipid phosphatase